MNCERKTICAFCVRSVADPRKDRDHIPGRQFFPDPKPSKPALITVPSCRDCQKKYKKVEDYARALICFGPGGVSEAGKSLWSQKLKRMYAKDKGLRRIIARALRKTNVFTPEGLWAGTRMTIDTDWSRMKLFMEKVVRGLYFFEFEDVLPADAHIDFPRGFGEDVCGENPYDLFLTEGKRAWPGIFEYTCWRGNGKRSAWKICFYGTATLFIATVEQADLDLRGKGYMPQVFLRAPQA